MQSSSTRGASPFFWDDFDRPDLFDGPVSWQAISWGRPDPEDDLQTEAGDLIITPDSESVYGIVTQTPELQDLTIRTRVRFDADVIPWRKPFAAIWARDLTDGFDQGDNGYWAGLDSNGILQSGMPLDGLLQTLRSQSAYVLEQLQTTDVNLELVAIGNEINLKGWLDGTPPPLEPQAQVRNGQFDSGLAHSDRRIRCTAGVAKRGSAKTAGISTAAACTLLRAVAEYRMGEAH